MQVFDGVARRVVVLSSMDVYRAYDRFRGVEPGEPELRPLTEDAPLRERLFPYRSQAKDENDLLFHYEKILVERAVLGQADLAGTVLRLPCVYGPGDDQHRTFEYLKRMDDGRSDRIFWASLGGLAVDAGLCGGRGRGCGAGGNR